MSSATQSWSVLRLAGSGGDSGHYDGLAFLLWVVAGEIEVTGSHGSGAPCVRLALSIGGQSVYAQRRSHRCQRQYRGAATTEAPTGTEPRNLMRTGLSPVVAARVDGGYRSHPASVAA